MIIFGYKIECNENLRTNPLSIVFLLMIPGLIYLTLTNTGYLADYRFGESIIPSESQLSNHSGFSMQRQTTRNDSYIVFTSEKTGEKYSITESNFPPEIHIKDVVHQLDGKPVANLGVYFDNPIQKVWRVTVPGSTLLSYERALFCYRIDINPAWW